MDIREICLPIADDLASLEGVIKDSLKSQVPFVAHVVDYVIQKAGKRLRPILTILSARLAGSKNADAISIGAALEFMHTASLLHDDVLDDATIRRGRAAINKKWGNHVSVLVGDFFYCRAMDILVRQGNLKILRSVTDAITRTTEGQILEITKTNDLSISQDDYLEIITGKTAVLIGSACHVGAILGNVSEDFEEALRKFGFYLGVAFQLMDDVLDYTSSTQEFGKEGGTDLKEGKLTLPLLLTINQCTESELQEIKNSLMADDVETQILERITQIIEQYDGIRDTTKLARSYIQKAKDCLSPFKPSIEKETLSAIADYVLIRRN